MVDSSTVWMVHALTGSGGVKGTLTLEADRLVFSPSDEPAHGITFGLSGIRKVRRVLGSPVMEIQVKAAGAPSIVGFYFVKPPSLGGDEDQTGSRRRQARKSAVRRLRGWNAVKKNEVTDWVKAIRQASRG